MFHWLFDVDSSAETFLHKIVEKPAWLVCSLFGDPLSFPLDA